jgi:hypothetical protein
MYEWEREEEASLVELIIGSRIRKDFASKLHEIYQIKSKCKNKQNISAKAVDYSFIHIPIFVLFRLFFRHSNLNSKRKTIF